MRFKYRIKISENLHRGHMKSEMFWQRILKKIKYQVSILINKYFCSYIFLVSNAVKLSIAIIRQNWQKNKLF